MAKGRRNCIKQERALHTKKKKRKVLAVRFYVRRIKFSVGGGGRRRKVDKIVSRTNDDTRNGSHPALKC